MKIIALLPFKNEAHVLPSYLSTVKPLVDEIIAIDDGSTDKSAEIMKKAGATVLSWEKERMKFGWAELGIRQKLLELGREAGGTHFVILDADETFTRPFLKVAHRVLERLEPGQRVCMQWLAMWKSVDHYRDDSSVWSNNYKDFVFRDNPENTYPEVWMHTPRTPGPFANADNSLTLNPKYGAVMHFQFSNWDTFQIKQCWCRISELIKDGNASSINQKYRITLDSEAVVVPMPDSWKEGVVFPKVSYYQDISEFWRLKEIEKRFEEHGPQKFKDLEIWHVPQIREAAKKYGR
jgi:glycosyltransferase involved in cell wall biosynthesis